MKLTQSALAAAVTYSVAINAAPATENVSVEKRSTDHELTEILNSLEQYRSKRDQVYDTLDKREYEIVTDVLSALNNTGLAPKIIKYLATSPTLQPIVIKTIVTVLKSGLLDLTTLFQALDESGLVTKVVQDLISDCSLYQSLFNTAASVISNLLGKVEQLISSKLSRRELLADSPASALTARDVTSELDARAIDLDDIVVNLLESLGNSGLASSVVKSIITDPDYIPFAVDLVKQVLASNSLDLGEVIDALKNTNLASNLLKTILNAKTFDTVITNAFAAFSGKCGAPSNNGGSGGNSGSSGNSGNSGSGNSGSKGTTTPATDPCKKRRRRRRRTNYNY